MVDEALESLESGYSLHFSDRHDPADPALVEETVILVREGPDRFRAMTQSVFHDGSTMAASPVFQALDRVGARARIAELAAAGFRWITVPPPAP